MKQKIVTSLVLLSFLAVASPAYAEEGSTGQYFMPTPGKARVEVKAEFEARKASSTERRLDARAEIEMRKASSTEMREARKASTTAKRIEVKQNIAKRQMERAGKVLTAAITRLENILARLESRISKVKAEGGVVTESEGYVADTKVYLGEARADLAAFVSIEVTADNFETVREAGAEVKTEIKKAHESLVNAIRSLKPGRAKVNATSAVEVSN